MHITVPTLSFDTAYFHHICIYVLYASAGLLTCVWVERLVFYMLLNVRAGGLAKVVAGTARVPEVILTRRDLLSRSLSAYITAVKDPASSRAWLEDLSAAQFITVSSRIGARLWILDTIVTAAPLLGLFGTILGIMDTFHALSGGGISDPAAVSRGIADALLATAIGIGVALYGLLGHNILHRYADHLTEEFKGLILASHALAQPRAATLARSGELSAIGQRFGHSVAAE